MVVKLKLRDVIDCDGDHKYIVWNSKEIKIDGKSVFYKRYYSKGIKYTEELLYEKTNIGIKYTKELLYEKSNIDSFNSVDKRLEI
mgnify:CR=1 FL=1